MSRAGLTLAVCFAVALLASVAPASAQPSSVPKLEEAQDQEAIDKDSKVKTVPPADQEKDSAGKPKSKKDGDSEEGGGKDDGKGSSLKDLGFGLGLGFRWNVFKPDQVEDAVVDANGIVRVNKRANTHAGFTFETHYLFKKKDQNYGIGPFVAAEAGSDSIITSVGLGAMIAWKIDDKGHGFGLGFGYSAQPGAKVLGSEFVEDQPAPVGADGKPLPIRFQERDKGSILAILSVIF
jgi:hypothetical protein